MFAYLNDKIYFGNTLKDYAIALAIFIGVIILITIIRKIIISFINKKFPNTEQITMADVIHSFKKRLLPITYIIAIYSSLSFLKVNEVAYKIIDKGIVIFISIFVILFVTDFIRIYSLSENKNKVKIPSGLVSVIQGFIWIIGLLFIFSNLGYNVSTFITGLGIGGVAIALASQAILGDLFNYFVILFDKPFKKGDTIQIDAFQGVVEYIGIKTTRLRSVTGEQLLISNTDLTKARLQNYENMTKRRNITIIGVEYSTDKEILKKIPSIIEEAIKNIENVELARVYFKEFGASSLNFEVAYYVLSNIYKDFIETVQDVNYAIYFELSKIGVSFAFPSQTLYIAKNDDE